jgi:hypothetical protein
MSKFRMTVEPVDVPAERRRKITRVTVLALTAAVVLGGGAFTAWYLTPPALPTTIEEAVAVASSPRYKRLSDKQKQPYLDVVREQFGSLDREERRAMIGRDEDTRDMARDAMRSMMRQYMKSYGAATYEQRQAMLQSMSWGRPGGEPRGGEGRGERGEGGEGGRGGWRGDPGQMRNRISERMANGNAQAMSTIGVMISERRAQQDR